MLFTAPSGATVPLTIDRLPVAIAATNTLVASRVAPHFQVVRGGGGPLEEGDEVEQCITSVISFRSDDPLLPAAQSIVPKNFRAFTRVSDDAPPTPFAFVGLDDLVGVPTFEPGTTTRISVREDVDLPLWGSLSSC